MNVYPPAASGGASLYPPNVTSADAALASDVAITAANTMTDGPSISLVAGTWIIIATVVILTTAGTVKTTARIWDGTTVSGEGESTGGSAATNIIEVTVIARIVLAGTTTIKVSAAISTLGTSPLIKANPADNSGASDTATRITAFRVA